MARTIRKFRKEKWSDERDRELRFSPRKADVPEDPFCELHFGPMSFCHQWHTPIQLRIERHLKVVK